MTPEEITSTIAIAQSYMQMVDEDRTGVPEEAARFDEDYAAVGALGERLKHLEEENANLRTTVQHLNNLLVIVKDGFPEVLPIIQEALDELDAEQAPTLTDDPQG
jgi:predicted nuclease with TOPRIM domain